MILYNITAITFKKDNNNMSTHQTLKSLAIFCNVKIIAKCHFKYVTQVHRVNSTKFEILGDLNI